MLSLRALSSPVSEVYSYVLISFGFGHHQSLLGHYWISCAFWSTWCILKMCGSLLLGILFTWSAQDNAYTISLSLRFLLINAISQCFLCNVPNYSQTWPSRTASLPLSVIRFLCLCFNILTIKLVQLMHDLTSGWKELFMKNFCFIFYATIFPKY
jgi:hypothetical protein